MRRLLKGTVLAALLLVMSLLGSAGASAAEDQTYQYVVGTDFLCGLDPSACPAIAMAKNGDTVEVTGAGAVTVASHNGRSAGGGGTFVHKDADGNLVGEGTWEAVKLLSFQSYGSGSAQGLPEEFWGGRAHLRVEATPAGAPPGTVFTGILEIDCVLGDKIPASAEEGVTLNVPGIINFNEKVSGFTVFIRE